MKVKDLRKILEPYDDENYVLVSPKFERGNEEAIRIAFSQLQNIVGADRIQHEDKIETISLMLIYGDPITYEQDQNPISSIIGEESNSIETTESSVQ